LSRKSENQGFICLYCGASVLPLNNGSYRNHCPKCLHSLHVDILMGDRSSSCKGLMIPIGIKTNSKKGMQLIHKCISCNEVRVNKVAIDDNQPDEITEIMKLM